MKTLKYIALLGNALYILWIVYNGIDEGFQAIGSLQAFVLGGLIILLVINLVLLSRQK